MSLMSILGAVLAVELFDTSGLPSDPDLMGRSQRVDADKGSQAVIRSRAGPL